MTLTTDQTCPTKNKMDKHETCEIMYTNAPTYCT